MTSMSASNSLLQEVLRPQAFGIDRLNSKLSSSSISRSTSPTKLMGGDDSDDELVGVMSIPGSPSRSAAPSRQPSRPSSPTRLGASRRPVPGPLHIAKIKAANSKDPLRAFPTEVSQRIFGYLRIRDLARCSRVCRKWEKSQTLNYVWFQIMRRDQFPDETLPPGKWTRRESKQNWRQQYIQTVSQREEDLADRIGPIRSSRPTSPHGSRPGSGYVTPREIREEKWRHEAEDRERPTKNEMREMYKELGGRKTRGKSKFGGATRDRGGWGEGGGFDDGF